MEYFAQYHVTANKRHRDFFKKQGPLFAGRAAAIQKQLDQPGLSEEQSYHLKDQLKNLTWLVRDYQAEQKNWDQDAFENLSSRKKSLYEKAFCTNSGDPAYRELAELKYQDGADERKCPCRKGTRFTSFAKDVKR